MPDADLKTRGCNGSTVACIAPWFVTQILVRTLIALQKESTRPQQRRNFMCSIKHTARDVSVASACRAGAAQWSYSTA